MSLLLVILLICTLSPSYASGYVGSDEGNSDNPFEVYTPEEEEEWSPMIRTPRMPGCSKVHSKEEDKNSQNARPSEVISEEEEEESPMIKT